MMLDISELNFDKPGLLYKSAIAAVNSAKAIPETIAYPYPTNIHFHWHVGLPFGRKQVVAIKAALTTQDLRFVKVYVWCNVDLTDNEWFKPVAPYVTFHVYDPIAEAEGTSLEGLAHLLSATDHLGWLQSDLFRILILYKYGGVYVDQDVILLRSLAPLLGNEWMYQWGSELDKINGAVMHMRRGSTLGQILLGFLPWVPVSKASTDWSSTLYSAVRCVYSDWLVLPCAWFNTEWQMGWNMGESAHPFRRNPRQSSELFNGVFAWHWHNKWDAPIEKGSKYEILETIVNERFNADAD